MVKFGGSEEGLVPARLPLLRRHNPAVHSRRGRVVDRSRDSDHLVWCLRNNYTFVALKLAWGEARGRECIRSDTRPTEQRSPRPISAQPEGRHVFWAEALLLAPHRSTSGYALVPVRKHLAPSLRPKSIAANV